MVALFLLGQKWRGHKVLARCDNEAVVVILNKRYSKDLHQAHMLRTLFFVEAHFQLQLKAVRIPGSHNTLTNLLSRNQVPKFHSIHPSANIFPLFAPLSLLQWLLDLKMDWISEPWTQLFNTFVNKAYHQLLERHTNLHCIDLPTCARTIMYSVLTPFTWQLTNCPLKQLRSTWQQSVICRSLWAYQSRESSRHYPDSA